MSRLVRAAGSISGFTLLSRVLGLVRDSLMTQALGASWVQGTLLLAWMLPNLMRRLLGEGALSAALVPAYTTARQREGPEPARRLLAQVAGLVATILLPLCAIVAVASLVLPPEWLPPPEQGGLPASRLLLQLNALLFLYALPVCLTAVYSGAMNSLGMFALPAAVPVVLNVFWISAVVAAPALGFRVDTEIAWLVAVALTIGGFAQLLLVTVPLWRRGELLRPPLGVPPRGSPARAVFVAMAPTVVGMSLNQVSSLLDQLMAFYLVAPGAVTYIYLANRLLLFPHALTALSVAVAVFPRLAAEATAASRETLARTLHLARAATLLVTLPAALGLVVLAPDIVRVLFESAKFDPADVAPTVLTSRCLVAGLPFIGLAQLHARAYYAVGDTRTPARLALWLLLGNAALNLVLLATTSLGTAALALSSSIAAVANALALARRFRRHAQLPSLRGAWLRSGGATAVMCAVLPFTRLCAEDAGRLARAFGNVAVPIVAGMVVYAAVRLLLRGPEVDALRSRLGRGR